MRCDLALRGRFDRASGIADCWEDIPSIASPVTWLRWAIALSNELRGGHVYEDKAFEQYKALLINLYPHVAREFSREELEEKELHEKYGSIDW